MNQREQLRQSLSLRIPLAIARDNMLERVLSLTQGICNLIHIPLCALDLLGRATLSNAPIITTSNVYMQREDNKRIYFLLHKQLKICRDFHSRFDVVRLRFG